MDGKEQNSHGYRGRQARQGQQSRTDWPRLAAMIFCIGAAVALLWFFMNHALGVALPFLLAWLLSLVIRPLVKRLTARSRLPRGPVAAVLVLLLTGLAGWLCVLGVRRAVSELENLILRLGGVGEDARGSAGVAATVTQIMDWVNSLSEHIPLIRHFEEKPGFAAFCAWLDESVREAASRLVSEISGRLSAAAMDFVRGLPSMFVFAVVLLLSCYYFTADNGRVRAGILSVLPARVREKLPALRERASWFARRYLRAYLLLWLITFAEMFLGLSILGIPYAFLLAILIAVVDFLPVFGTGTVLIPWAVASLLTRDLRTGLGLLILYGVSVIVREVAEPRLIGAQLGIHPLLSLAVMYAGLRFFGLPGMLLSPVFAIVIKFLLSDATGRGGGSSSVKAPEVPGK